MDLHYTHTDSKLRQTESKHMDIGKPLVASCELNRKRNHAATNTTHEGASARSMGNIASSKPLLPQTQAGSCRPFTRMAVCATKAAVRSNEPEENDENELRDFALQYQ